MNKVTSDRQGHAYGGKTVLSRVNHKYKILESGICLACLKNSEKAVVAGAE